MWILLFTAVLSVAICLCVAAIVLSPLGQDSLNVRTDRRLLAQDTHEVRRKASCDPQANGIRLKTSDDVLFLLRRMALLDIAPHHVNNADPLLFRELQGRCSLCPSKTACSVDLAREAADGQGRDWAEYCPNAAMLALLSRVSCANALPA